MPLIVPERDWNGWEAVAPIRATAALLRMTLEDAVKVIDAEDPKGGLIQLCPQNGASERTPLDLPLIERLKFRYPGRRFRLHANHRIIRAPAIKYDASTVDAHWSMCFRPLAELNRALDGDVYSLHAGRQCNSSRTGLVRDVIRLERLFGCPVAVEGMYPTHRDDFHVADSEGYRWLLSSGLSTAIDVSHLHIVRTREGGFDEGLLDALLQSERCLEIHLSHNNGRSDLHAPLPPEPPWWWNSVRRAVAARPNLPVLCESHRMA
jgi:hypothetical protein